MFGPIQFGGLASGLDTGAIIEALLQIEAQPIKLLQAQKESEESKLSLLGTLEGLVDDLRDKAEKLSGLDGFLAYEVLAGSEGIATFTLTGGEAAVGSHELEVLSLASSDRYTFLAASPITDPDAALGAGTISFDYDGTSYSIDIQSGSDSLNQVAAAINSEAGDAVTASVINTGTESSANYQLVIAGDDTGADFSLDNLTVTGALGTSLGAQDHLTTASNASVVIDGLKVERSSNVFSDVIEGVSFTVQTVERTSFSVSLDNEGIKQNVQEFVDAYNAVIGFINEQNEFDPDDGASSELFGDAALSTIQTTISNALLNVDIEKVKADTEGYSTLGLVGIDLQTDGTFVIDDAQFDEKLSANVDALADLFVNEVDGLAGTLEQAIGGLVDSTVNELGETIDGLFDRRDETLNSIIGSLDDRIEQLEYNLEQVEQTLVAKFTALEELMAGLNAQAAFLAGQFAF